MYWVDLGMGGHLHFTFYISAANFFGPAKNELHFLQSLHTLMLNEWNSSRNYTAFPLSIGMTRQGN